jgi:hypothetical protein
MPINQEKVVKIILGNMNAVETRYDDYHKSIQHLVGEILLAERVHQTQRGPIIQEISDKINTVGMDLYRENEDLYRKNDE